MAYKRALEESGKIELPDNVVKTDEDFLNNMLNTDTEKKISDLDVLKELFTKKEIESKTELTDAQIVLVNQKRVISRLLEWDSLNDALDDYMVLMVSRNRKGRGEFVDGFKSERETTIKGQSGFFSRIGEKLSGQK